MRDLEIWRNLADGTIAASDLLAIGHWSIARRGPYLGKIVELAAHTDPVIRAAAITALAGARGVPGVRAIVAGLDDDDDGVRRAAVAALRDTAREAPYRYVHALFHGRPDVRLEALAASATLSSTASELGVYLRADPICSEAARAVPWPSESLGIAIDLHERAAVTASELVALLWKHEPANVRTFLTRERQRTANIVDAYLAACELVAPPGSDHLDTMIAAIVTASEDQLALVLDRFVQMIGPNKARALARRTVVAILAWLVRHPSAPAQLRTSLLAVACACDPRVLALSLPELAAAAAFGLVRYQWPVKLPLAETLVALEAHAGDLALAAAIAGMLPAKRLATLAKAFQESRVIDALVASDHGWSQICALPGETPALEFAWLAQVEKRDYKRYIALAGRTIAAYGGKRLDAFVDQIPRRHRLPVFFAALRAHEHAEVERIAGTCKAIAHRIDRAGLTGLLESLLALAAEPRRRLVLGLIREVDDKLLATAVVPLTDAYASVLVEVLGDPDDPPPRSRELAVANALGSRSVPAIRAWVSSVAFVDTPLVVVPPPPKLRRALSSEERATIMSASPSDLARALAPALATPVTGLASALAVVGANPHAIACAALMACGDPIADVARQLERFSGATEIQIDREMRRWQHVTAVPPLANAWLYRWESHTLALAAWLKANGRIHEILRFVDSLGDGLAGRTLWQGISEVLMFVRYRDLARFSEEATEALALFCAERVDRPIGRHAARIVVALVEGKAVPVTAVRDRVLDRIGDADAETRELAARLVRLDGMPAPPAVARTPASADLVATIRKTTDLDALVGWCRHGELAIVDEAVLALLVLGPRGQLQLAELLDRLREVANPLPIVASVQLWEEPAAIARARELAARPTLPAAWKFYLNLALAARGDAGALEAAIEAAREPTPDWYFRRDDWDALLRVSDELTCSIALADSPHHHAYQRAIGLLLCIHDQAERVNPAIVRFLEVDGDRPLHLRRDAAAKLLACGDPRGMPLVVEQLFDPAASSDDLQPPFLGDALEHLVAAALVGGPGVVSESRMWALVEVSRRKTTALVRERIYGRILDEATTTTARRGAAQYAVAQSLGHERLARVAEVFAWGIKRGVELTGRFFSFHLTTKESEFGHTRMKSDQIFVSPLPMLRGEANGQDIVEGLVLHEIGHHVYHRGEVSEAIWEKAHREGVGHLLNLVADEHLERNLRAVDPAYGDRLKRLGAYAFQHAPQQIAVPVLLGSLRGAAAAALINSSLEVGFAEHTVRLRRGHVLIELDRANHPLARFMRAFRLGHGNRTNDPKLAEALALCQGIRDMTMLQLYDLTWKLAHLFGGAVEVASVFGGSEGLEAGDHERDDDVFGAGVSDDALQKEIQRVLDPRRNKREGKKGVPDRLWINVAEENDFDRITHVERVRGTPEAHRQLVQEVDRHATRLRAYLDDLGLRWEPQRARTRGRAIDRTRLLPLVTRNDPRILIARTPHRRTDLFLGVIVDCSGSMSSRDNIGRAKRFAALVANAVEPLPGVEARFFGFTDSTIYDAGTALDCGVSGLRADGGNNDAAALFHAANVAMASNKRAKVLVMISDGLPTECSVESLRALVTTLTRRKGIVCAQVAVHALEEVCFPNYVLLDGAVETAVARFGRMIGDLARRSLLL